MSLFAAALLTRAEHVLAACRARGLTLATAESCTGGLIAALLTEIPGSSDVVVGGFITYANAAKTSMIGVDAALIDAHGAVSEPVARAMAEGAIKASDASLTIAVTGIAGPGGATATKPIGLVHIACARAGKATLHRAYHFSGERSEIRLCAVDAALEMIQEML